MRISQFFIVRPIFAAVVSVVITIIGAIGYWGLGVTQLPEITPPTITITANYPGASAQTVADTVAAPIEQEVNGVEGMIYMASQSTADGNVSLTVTFEVGTDIDKAQVLVQNRVSAAERRLPDEVRRNGLTVRKRSPDLLLAIHLISPDNTYDSVYISNYGLLNVRDKLMRLYGVGDVWLFGVREYSMRVWLDPERIALRGLTAEQVMEALRAQNVQVAGGALGEPPIDTRNAFQVSLQMKGRLRTADEFEDIIVKMGNDGRVVRVKDIARVELGALSYLAKGYADRYPAVIIVVDQQPGSNAVAATQGIKDTMAEMAKSFPKGLEYRITYNPTEFIEVSIKKLYITILEATILVVLVVLLFLKTWRATLIPIVAIPVSLVGTCAVMQAFGFSLNMLTLFGLVLSVGIVVDDAIVVVENVERKLKEGLSPMRAAQVSMDEVGAALVAIALVLLAVFIPTTFIGGITGMFYRQFAVTIATATAISLFVSLTLSPALCALLFKPHKAHDGHGSALMAPVHAFFRIFDRGFDAMARGYGRLVRGLARTWVVVLIAYVALIGFAGWFVPRLPTGFIPALDRAILIISLQLPPGASLARTDAVVQRAIDLTLKTPGVKYSNAFTGRNGATFTAATNAGLIFLVLDDFEERHRSRPDHRPDRPGHARRARPDRRGAGVRLHPAAGARHGRGRRLLHAAAGYARHARERLCAHHAGVRRRGQPHARHRQRLHHLPVVDAAGLCRRRPRQGADAQGARDGHLRGHARVHGLGLRQRLQHVRPHLPRDGAGRRRLPPRSRQRVQDPRAQRRRADGAARQPRDLPGDCGARACAALQSVPVRRGQRHGATRRQLRPVAADHARAGSREAAPRRHVRVDRPVLPGSQGGTHRLLHLRARASSSCSWRCPPSTRAGRCRSPSC